MDLHSTRRHLSLTLAAVASIAGLPRLAAADGGPDTTFSGDGQMTWALGDPAALVGVATSESKAYAFGSIDLDHVAPSVYFRSVSNSGAVTTPGCAQATETLFTLSSESLANDGLIDASGNLLLVGSASFVGTEDTSRPLAARFDLSSSGCELDDSFSSNGWATYSQGPCATASCFARDVVEIGPLTGSVDAPRLVLLVARGLFGGSEFFLLGLTGSGAVDTQFGSSGWVTVDLPAEAAWPDAALASDALGRLYLAFATAEVVDDQTDWNAYLLRFDADGEQDPDFGPSFGVLQLPEDGVLSAMQTNPLGVEIEPGGVSLTAYRHDADGLSTYAYLDQPTDDALRSTVLTSLHLAVQGDRKVLTAGDIGAFDGFQLTRRTVDLAANLPMDSTFGNVIVDVDSPIGNAAETVSAVTLWNGRPLVLGTVDGFPDDYGFLYRGVSSYVFADGFEQGTPAYWSGAAGVVFP